MGLRAGGTTANTSASTPPTAQMISARSSLPFDQRCQPRSPARMGSPMPKTTRSLVRGFLLMTITAMAASVELELRDVLRDFVLAHRLLLLLEEHDVLEHQRVDVRRQEALVGVGGRADDGLAADIEARVD